MGQPLSNVSFNGLGTSLYKNDLGKLVLYTRDRRVRKGNRISLTPPDVGDE